MPRPIRQLPARARWTADHARAVLAALERSGQSVRAFAEERGIDPQRLYAWRRRVAGGDAITFHGEMSLGGAPKSSLSTAVLPPLQYARYADDVVVLIEGGRDKAENTRNRLGTILREKLEMNLSYGKTHVRDLHDGFDFLGHFIQKVETPAGSTCRVSTSKKKLARVLDDLNEIARTGKKNRAEERARERVEGFLEYYFLVAEDELQETVAKINKALEELGLKTRVLDQAA